MNKSAFFTILCWCLLSGAFPQTKQDFIHAGQVAQSAPDSVEVSIQALSDYFLENLASEKELARSFYYWTAHEISYDVENMFTFRSADNPGMIIVETLRDKKAVCQGYSEVFHELCVSAGIESYVVRGYTKQNGQVTSVPHAWVVARIDTSWFFFDPTWGSGFITNDQFTPKFTSEYCMVKPAVFIKSHMPFDPLWQCLYYPLNSGNFYQGAFPRKDSASYFSFPDSIAAYVLLPETEQFAAALRRLGKNGVVNNGLSEYQRYLQQSLEVDRINQQNELQNEKVKRFNVAVNHYNSAAFMFNDYINYWNRQFKPPRPEAQIRAMLDSCDYHLAQSRKILATIDPRQEDLAKNMEMLATPANDIQKRVDEQRGFLRDYFSTSKALRPTLFGKYSWMGGSR